MDIPATKTCARCQQTKPLSEFHNAKNTKDGRSPWCKICQHKYNSLRQYSTKIVVSEKPCNACKQVKPIEQFGKDKYTCDGYATRCFECKRLENEEFRKKYPEKAPERTARYRKNHPEKIKAYADTNRENINRRRRERYANNPERELIINKAWYDSHPDFSRERMQRRRSRMANIPHTFAAEHRAFMLQYWHHACAICGNQEGFFWQLAEDHWIPVTSPDCPGTIATNIVPLCHGKGGCNNAKGYSHPTTWLLGRFGPKKAKSIQQTIEAYFLAVAAKFFPLSLTGD